MIACKLRKFECFFLVGFSHFGWMKRFEKIKSKPDKLEQSKEQKQAEPITSSFSHENRFINICHFKITKMLLFRFVCFSSSSSRVFFILGILHKLIYVSIGIKRSFCAPRADYFNHFISQLFCLSFLFQIDLWRFYFYLKKYIRRYIWEENILKEKHKWKITIECAFAISKIYVLYWNWNWMRLNG